MCAAEARRARGGESWRVRLEPDGAIVIEPQPAPQAPGGAWAPDEPPPAGERHRIVL